MAKKKTAKKKSAQKPKARRSPDFPVLAKMRGVPNFDNEDAVILVRSSCAEVAEAFKKRKKLKTWIQNAVGKSVTIAGASYLVLQLKGHPWVTIYGFTGEVSPQFTKINIVKKVDAKALSKSLATKVIFFGNSDTSCVTEYDFYENGRHNEHFDNFDGVNFNSKLRDIDPPVDGPEIYPFIDAFIAEQDAFVAGWSHFVIDGWRHKKGDKVKLDFFGVSNATILRRLDFISA